MMEHHLDNHKEDKNVYINGFHGFMIPHHQLSVPSNSNHHHSNHHLANNSTHSSSAITSSTSSERALIHHGSTKPYRLNLPYCLLVFAILFLTLSVISIAITFIFPFWIRLTLQNNATTVQTVSTEYLNITNVRYNLCLLTMNYTGSDEAAPTSIIFDLGLWEVKMQQELEFYDMNTRTIVSQNMYPQTMLWLNGDVNNYYQSFLIKLLQFIDLKGSYVFLIQILEIVHLIFAFLTVTFTSYTLCLCANHRFDINYVIFGFR
jgi:hypothetical protein